MSTETVSSLEDEPQAGLVARERSQLNVLSRECAAVKARLQDGNLDRPRLRQLESRTIMLCDALADHAQTYLRLRGAPTNEGDALRSLVAMSRRDLDWTRSHRRLVPDRRIADRLIHSIQSADNALSLLRWCWV